MIKKNVQEEIDRLRRGLDMVLVNARLENFEDDMQVERVALKAIVTATVNENKRLFITKRVFLKFILRMTLLLPVIRNGFASFLGSLSPMR